MDYIWTKWKTNKKALSAICLKRLFLLVPPARLERTTPRLGIWCSIHLSYGGNGVSFTTTVTDVK